MSYRHLNREYPNYPSPDEVPVWLPPYEVRPIPFNEVKNILLGQQIQGWHVDYLRLPKVWKIKSKGKGVIISVIDTGKPDHQDLQDLVINAGTSFPEEGLIDKHSHATFCVGLIAARNNEIGTVGVLPEADSIITYKSLDKIGRGTVQTVNDGIYWSVENGADILSLSLGSDSDPHPTTVDAINYALSKGCIIFAAAGNSSRMVGSPANIPGVVSVASHNEDGVKSYFSNYGPKLVLSMPGEGIVSTVGKKGYAYWDGTSMATPLGAALAGAYVSEYGNPGPVAFIELLKKSIVDMGAPGWDEDFGHGRIDATILDQEVDHPVPPEEEPIKEFPLWLKILLIIVGISIFVVLLLINVE
jgi:subtilisin family serine protease